MGHRGRRWPKRARRRAVDVPSRLGRRRSPAKPRERYGDCRRTRTQTTSARPALRHASRGRASRWPIDEARPLLRRGKLRTKLGRFAVVGVANTVIDLTAFALFARAGAAPLVANCLGWLTAAGFSYLANRRGRSSPAEKSQPAVRRCASSASARWSRSACRAPRSPPQALRSAFGRPGFWHDCRRRAQLRRGALVDRGPASLIWARDRP